MNLKTYINFYLHCIKAKRRHGTHSPFVYGYAEQVLHDTSVAILPSAKSPQLTTLIKKTLQYINPKAIENRTNFPIAFQHNKAAHSFSEMLLIDFQDNFESHKHYPLDYLVILQKNDTAQLHHWNQLCQQNQFTISMDVWNIGILLTNSKFKVKQHFLLK